MAGTLVVDEPGVYHLVWDNSYSWMRKKVVSYKIEVRDNGIVGGWGRGTELGDWFACSYVVESRYMVTQVVLPGETA